MKTEKRGGASADEPNDGLEERLSGRFTVELGRAERDYAALRQRLEVGAAPARRRAWPIFALPVASAAVLAIAVLALSGLLVGSVPSSPPPPAAQSPANGVVLGADGIPTQIDGEQVYGVADNAAWRPLTTSFLLKGYPSLSFPTCPIPVRPGPTADADLVPWCQSASLLASEDSNSASVQFAPKSPVDFLAWEGSPQVVLRVHLHDPEAAQCSAAQADLCGSTPVAEAVVWPSVPTEIAGQRVYRNADRLSFPNAGTFLLGGLFMKPQFAQPCPMPVDQNAAQQQLLPYCDRRTIDGLQIAPKSVIDEPTDEIVVARVHADDQLAQQCPAVDRTNCQASIVVESIVWRSNPYAAVPTPAIVGPNGTPGTIPGSTPVPSPPSLPTPATTEIPLFPDLNAPSSLGDEIVYRAKNLPPAQSFLFAGKLTRDTTCAPPATPLARPPACGYWMLDGVRIGTQVDLPEALLGQAVVARVDRGRVVGICVGGSCVEGTLVIVAIVWPANDVVPPPPAPTPTALAS
jgi:hypothetical protein